MFGICIVLKIEGLVFVIAVHLKGAVRSSDSVLGYAHVSVLERAVCGVCVCVGGGRGGLCPCCGGYVEDKNKFGILQHERGGT